MDIQSILLHHIRDLYIIFVSSGVITTPVDIVHNFLQILVENLQVSEASKLNINKWFCLKYNLNKGKIVLYFFFR